MPKYLLPIVLLITLLVIPIPAQGQESLPADLYILTSDQRILRIDSITGEQQVISPDGQPVTDFDIAPDGMWYAYRTSTNAAVIISEMGTGNGFVAQFEIPPPPDNASGPTMAWAPDASALAYLVPQGVRIEVFNASEYGDEFMHPLIQGSGWTEIYWSDSTTLIATSAAGPAVQIVRREDGGWDLNQASDIPLRSNAVPATLTDQGVILDDGTLVPNTAGALAFDWGPQPLPLVTVAILPDNLYFIDQDSGQVWQLPDNADPMRQITTEISPVLAYDLSPDQSQIAYVVDAQLIVMALDGSNRRVLTTVVSEQSPFGLDWSPDGLQIAYTDGQGLWTMAVDGIQPPRLLRQHIRDNQQIDRIRVYMDPRWSPDGTKLLVQAGLFEGSILAMVDAQSGETQELMYAPTPLGGWTDDGRIMTWSAYFGYQTPGLYLLDPAKPEEPLTILGSSVPVLAAQQSSWDDWYILSPNSSSLGPQYVRMLSAPSLDGPFTRTGSGGYAQNPRLALSEVGIVVAGLLHVEYSGDQHMPSGELVIIDMQTGITVQVQTPGPVYGIQWGK
jgi:dipeptidyl aminopeptidase/acylaminoacyl peptidase